MLKSILSMEKNISAVIMYGYLSEQVISTDMTNRTVLIHLHTMLKNNGFDNIVFYDASHAEGKFVKDDESAVYCFNRNRGAYIKKYGQLPKGILNENEAVAISDNSEKDDELFGSLGTVVDETPHGSTREENEDTEIHWSEPNMQLIPFFGEMDHFMQNTSFRTCIIFTNLFDIISNGDPEFIRRLAHNLNFKYENGVSNNGNLIIFLQPDITDQNCLTAFTNALTGSSIRDKFMIFQQSGSDGNGRDYWRLDDERCFSFGVPDTDELELLLSKERISGRLDIEGSISDLANKLNYLLRESYERALANGMRVRPTTLTDLIGKIDNIARDNGGVITLNEKNLSQFCCIPVTLETDPMKKLRETKGWEGICDKITASIDKFLTLNPEFKQQTEPSDDEKEKYKFIPYRLRSCSKNSFPTVDILPSFMIAGPPGVGKTTVARICGRCFADSHMLRSGHVVCAKASDIISDHVGGTARLVTQLFDRAEDGILFIDEAYGLYSDPNDKSTGNFKREAIDAIVQAMTDNTRHLIVIFAGYPNSKPDSKDGVEALFNCNAGLRSRVKNLVYIKEYSAALLAEITMRRFRENKAGITVDSSITMEGLEMVFEKKLRIRNKKTFGNAREALEFADNVINEAVIHGRTVILPEDFPADFRDLVVCKKESFDDIIVSYNKRYPGGLGDIAGKIARKTECRIRSARKRSGRATKKLKKTRSLILTGRPGSGKTTIAKALPKLLGAMGIMSGTDAVVIKDAAACTPAELQEKIDQAVALNTVLFIDEAYSMRPETLTALLSPMTDESLELVVIFALYEKEYEDFKKKNDGIASRCDHISIPDYTPSQLMDIFKRMCDDIGYSYSDELVKDDDNLGLLFKNWYDTREINDSYANARDVENLIDKMATRCDMRNNDIEEVTDYTLTVSDIPEKETKLIAVLRKNADPEAVLAEFNAYYGFDELKEIVTSISDSNQVGKVFAKFYEKEPVFSLGHFAFVGPSGTGKTTAAELFARALYSVGLLKTPNFKKYLAGDLIGEFLGQTAGRTRQKLKEGRFGVILIDEAYHLMASDDRFNDDTYKKDAVNELLVFLEEEMGNTVVIFGGYEQQTLKMLGSHEGLSSRVTNIVRFHSYTEDECFEIFKLMLSKADPGYHLSPEAEEICREKIRERIAAPDYANARDMRTLADKCVASSLKRMKGYIKDQRSDEVTKEMFTAILPEDFS